MRTISERLTEASWRPDVPQFRPGVIAALGLVAGHALARTGGEALLFLATGAALLLTFGWWTRRWAPALVAAGSLAIGGAQQTWLLHREAAGFEVLEAAADGAGPLARVEGTLDAFPRATAAGWTLVLSPGATLGITGARHQVPATTVVRLTRLDEVTNGRVRQLVPGDQIAAAGGFYELPRHDLSGDPDDWLRSTGAVAVLRGRTVTLEHPAISPWARLLRLGQRTANSIEDRIARLLPPESAAVLVAMTLGRPHLLAPEQRLAFRRAGLMHLFAVSGLHTMIFGLLVLGLLNAAGAPPLSRLAILAAVLLFFAVMVGLRPSVLRAVVLLLIYESRYFLRRPVEPLSALGTVASAFMLLEPRAVWRVDFQMSFLAVTALLLVSPWLYAIQQHLGRALGWGWWSSLAIRAAQIFVASTVIQIFLAPVLATRFGEVSVIAPVANVFVLPTLPVLLSYAATGMAAGFLWPAAGDAILGGLAIPIGLVDAFAGAAGGLPFASMATVPWPSWASMALLALVVFGSWFRYRGRSWPRAPRWRHAPAVAALAGLAVWAPVITGWRDGLDVYFLDVGQGDAILVIDPAGGAILVDAGPDSAGPLLPRQLISRGVQRLDALILTHPDADHVGGTEHLLAEIPVSAIYEGPLGAGTREYAEVEQAAAQTGTSIARLAAGDVLPLADGAALRVLHPPADWTAHHEDRNDASLVLLLDYAGRRLLLTGDAEADAERALLSSGRVGDIDVLKAGHHGARTSTSDALLAAVRPEYAVLSAGRNNRYGHPATEVLERLARRGVATLRTDTMGTVRLKITPGGGMRWSTTRGGG